ncbi:MAG: DNA replication and repair protein RecF [Bacteroidota bacterium]
MHLRSLRLHSFRAHADTEADLAPGVNLLVGPNGAGKTNLLEAVHYLCLSKSFLTSTDAHALRRGESFFELEGTFSGTRRAEVRIRLAYAPREGKRALVNGSPLDRLADLVGRVPVVVLSPADHLLTDGGPSERRRFLDQTLSQAYPVYLDDLLKYRRALKQRNALLLQMRRGASFAPGTMEAWNEELALLGSRIVGRRRRFLTRFAEFLREAYARLGATGEEPAATYAPSVSAPPDDSNEPTTEADTEAFRMALARAGRRERETGRTLVGPHLDEVTLTLDGFEVRPYASQGQHRTMGLAMRIATALFLHDHLDEPPLLLLDDVFGALDPERTRAVLELLTSDAVGQSLVTSARSDLFSDMLDVSGTEHQALSVLSGTVAPFRSSTLLAASSSRT